MGAAFLVPASGMSLTVFKALLLWRPLQMVVHSLKESLEPPENLQKAPKALSLVTCYVLLHCCFEF